MNRLVALAISLVVAFATPAHAGRKSILRFHEKAKPIEQPEVPEKPALPSNLVSADRAPLLGGSSQEGWLLRLPSERGHLLDDLGKRPDWFGNKFGEKSDRSENGGKGQAPSAQGMLPGIPAVEEPMSLGGAPRKTSETPETGAQNIPIPSVPSRQQLPPAYVPAPRGVPTITGYDASVAPPGLVRIPAYDPGLAGQAPPQPRVLPRLAPYGSSLPPDQTTPPAAIPR